MEDVSIDVRMSPLPTMLQTVETVAETPCARRPDALPALELWEQARAGLLAAVVARDANPASVRILRYHRMLDPRGERILRQVVRSHTGTSTRPFSAVEAPVVFAERGYLEDSRAARTFYAPDADVLFDPSFGDTHCFHIERADGDHPDQVGIAFEPIPGRDTLVDVAGVLWLDRVVPAVRSLAFHYTNLEAAAQRTNAGGSMSFHTMPNGVVLIYRWSLTLPALKGALVSSRTNALPTRYGAEGSGRGRTTVTGIDETGGEVASAVWPDGARFEGRLGSVRGRVTAAEGRRPIAGALVWLVGQEDSTRTDSAGAFVLDGLVPGPYTLNAASDEMLATSRLGEAKEQPIVVGREPLVGRVIETRPGSLDAFEGACNIKYGLVAPLLVVSLRTTQGLPAEGAKVGVIRKASRVEPAVSPDRRREGLTDFYGRLLVCGVTRDRPLEISAQLGFADPMVIEVSIVDGHPVHLIEILLPP